MGRTRPVKDDDELTPAISQIAVTTRKDNPTALYFDLVGTIADIDETTTENPSHPAPVLLLEACEEIHRVVLPREVWEGAAEALQIGRTVRVGVRYELPAKPGAVPVAFHFAFADLN